MSVAPEQKQEPKYKQLWSIERASFWRAVMPESQLPIFVYIIRAQEIYCMVSQTEKTKIVDGADDRLMSKEFVFAIRWHQNPDLETAGHPWEVVELQPREIVQMLV